MCGHLRSPGPPQHRCRGAPVRRGEKQNQKRRENREGNPSRAGEGGSRQPPPRPRLRRGRRPLSALTCPAGPRRPHLPGARRGGAALAEELTWRRPRAGAAAAGAPQVRRGSGLRARGWGLGAEGSARRLRGPAAASRNRCAAAPPRASPGSRRKPRPQTGAGPPRGSAAGPGRAGLTPPAPRAACPGLCRPAWSVPVSALGVRAGSREPAARSTWAVGAPGQPVFCQAG